MPFHSRTFLLGLGLVLSPGSLAGQGVPSMDSTRLQPVTAAGHFLLHWTVDEGTNGEQTVFLRNVSPDRSITLSSWEIYDCVNLAGRACGVHKKGPVIPPGQTVRLVRLHAAVPDQGYAYRYRFTAGWTEPSADAP